MFKKGDLVRFRGRNGIVREVKLITLPWNKYYLCRVEFELEYDVFDVLSKDFSGLVNDTEWINERYLVKA